MANNRLSTAVMRAKAHALNGARSSHIRLNPPIDAVALATLMASLGRRPPQELLDWLNLHNGESGSIGLLGMSVHLMSSQEIGRTYLMSVFDEQVESDRDFMAVTGPMKQRRSSDKWIPFAQLNSAVACLDFDPPPEGTFGQVIIVDAEGSTAYVAYPSLAAMFEDL